MVRLRALARRCVPHKQLARSSWPIAAMGSGLSYTAFTFLFVLMGFCPWNQHEPAAEDMNSGVDNFGDQVINSCSNSFQSGGVPEFFVPVDYTTWLLLSLESQP